MISIIHLPSRRITAPQRFNVMSNFLVGINDKLAKLILRDVLREL